VVVTARDGSRLDAWQDLQGGKAKPTEDASCLTLDQALEEGVLEIRKKDGGDVPWVVVSNRSDKRNFIMGGEILSGCKQDRIVARDVWIAPYRKLLLLPVYCVEAGRRHHVSGQFKSEKNLGTYSIRAAVQGASGNNKSKIWNKIAESNRRMGVSSDTEAYQDAFTTEEVTRLVSDVRQKFKDLPLLENEPEGQSRGVDPGFEYSGNLNELSVSSLAYRDTVLHLGDVPHDETSQRSF